jgi:hypothetical protein
MNDSTPTHQPELLRLARRRVKARLGWLMHATVNVTVMAGLVLLAAWQGRSWPMYPALGWGLGLLMHGMAVFVTGSGSAWRERWIEQEHARLQHQRTRSTP